MPRHAWRFVVTIAALAGLSAALVAWQGGSPASGLLGPCVTGQRVDALPPPACACPGNAGPAAWTCMDEVALGICADAACLNLKGPCRRQFGSCIKLMRRVCSRGTTCTRDADCADGGLTIMTRLMLVCER